MSDLKKSSGPIAREFQGFILRFQRYQLWYQVFQVFIIIGTGVLGAMVAGVVMPQVIMAPYAFSAVFSILSWFMILRQLKKRQHQSCHQSQLFKHFECHYHGKESLRSALELEAQGSHSASLVEWLSVLKKDARNYQKMLLGPLLTRAGVLFGVTVLCCILATLFPERIYQSSRQALGWLPFFTVVDEITIAKGAIEINQPITLRL
ncbi:MAG: hypothetical protein OXC40_06505, partial [Proteobacteria bacterium]|nr:hypothetical protein [Pseudomonadota bacterium]